jgi:RNA polymerase sigma-70 factor (ECF subfamily)
VWNRADQWKGDGPFKAWLFRTATNLALNDLRSRKRLREQPLQMPDLREGEDDAEAVPGWMVDVSRPGADVALEREERRRMLRQLVGELSEEKREVFRMVYDEEMDVREVAQKLHIAEGTVKSRLHHGRKDIARKWEHFDNGREDS